MEATSEELAAIDGVGDVIAASITTWFANKQNRKVVEKLRKGGVRFDNVVVSSLPQTLLGKAVVVTGSIEGYSREEAEAVRAEIEKALSSLKVWRLITGFRGKHGDADAVIRAIEAISAFALANEGLVEELDVNPLLVFPDAVSQGRTTEVAAFGLRHKLATVAGWGARGVKR